MKEVRTDSMEPAGGGRVFSLLRQRLCEHVPEGKERDNLIRLVEGMCNAEDDARFLHEYKAFMFAASPYLQQLADLIPALSCRL